MNFPVPYLPAVESDDMENRSYQIDRVLDLVVSYPGQTASTLADVCWRPNSGLHPNYYERRQQIRRRCTDLKRQKKVKAEPDPYGTSESAWYSTRKTAQDRF